MFAQEDITTRPSDGSATGVFRSTLPTSALHKQKLHLSTVTELFQESVKLFPNRPMLGHRPKSIDAATGKPVWGDYLWQSYRRISERRVNLGSGIMSIYSSVCGGEVGDKFHVALYSVNRPAWSITDLALMSYGLITVPLYDTLGANASQYILNHANPPIVVCSFDKVEHLVSYIHKCPSVKAIISMDEVTFVNAQAFEILKKWAAEKGVALYSFVEVERMGSKKRIPFTPAKPDDLCCLSYTSGTTGEPKGAMLTHRNIVSFVLASSDNEGAWTENDVYLSYLPSAHVYEKVAFASIMATGGSIGFYRGDIALLLEDIATLKPTIFCSVPRLLNRIHDKIITQANNASAVSSYLFNAALTAKLENYDSTGAVTHTLWDPLVFRKVQLALGGRVRVIVTSSAPIHATVLKFMRVAFGCSVKEAYGMTECAGGITSTEFSDRVSGHVGAVMTGAEMKLVSVVEMNYHAAERRGEVWLRGPTVFKGYFRDEEKTREALTEDGWLKTGDIGRVDELGRLFIVDRKKNIFKLSQGEYIAPEKIENVYIKAKSISQMFVYGDSLRSSLVGVVVLDPETCIPIARKLGLLPSDTPDSGVILPGAPVNPHVKSLAGNAEFKKFVLEEMRQVANAAGLAGFECVKNVYLEAEAFSIENDLLTPNEYWDKDTGPAEALLIQRFEIEKNVPDRFNSLIDACVFLKAENCQCVRAGTQGRIPLVQIPGQAQWIVDRISSSLSSPSERLMYKVLVLVPSLALHEQNLNANFKERE
ncbi:Long-chain-fatty-acid--CoA ligase 5 [Rhizoclosmatium sp. JEL0117]|nr:Long-chain-fatty-acid--CoA ligase 5 [Rhizoclosmatium sp. JEL0117]